MSPEAEPLPIIAASDAPKRINADVPCIRCGYNLRTADLAGTCPECGQPNAASLKEFIRLRKKPGWQRPLARAATRLARGMYGIAIAIILVAVAVRWNRFPVIFLLHPIAVLSGFFGAVTCIVGFFQITAPSHPEARRINLRNLPRWICIALPLAIALGSPILSDGSVVGLLGVPAAVCLALLVYLRKTIEVSAPRLAEAMRWLQWTPIVAAVLAMSVALLDAPIGFVIGTATIAASATLLVIAPLLQVYAKVLRTLADHAEASRYPDVKDLGQPCGEQAQRDE